MKNIITIIFLFIFFTSCKENIYVDGKKSGKWTEYLDSSCKNEVSRDSAVYIRKLEYNNGYPVGLVTQLFKKNEKLNREFSLASGPYLQNVNRPDDKFVGLLKEFNDSTGKIENWIYYDEYGKINLKKYFVTGTDDILIDKRVDTSIFSKLKISNKDNKFYNNAESFDSIYPDLEKSVKNLYANSIARKLIKEQFNYNENELIFQLLRVGPAKSREFILLSKTALAMAKATQNYGTQERGSGNSHVCRWCNQRYYGEGYYFTYYQPKSIPFYTSDSDGNFCSQRCATEAKYAGGYEKN